MSKQLYDPPTHLTRCQIINERWKKYKIENKLAHSKLNGYISSNEDFHFLINSIHKHLRGMNATQQRSSNVSNSMKSRDWAYELRAHMPPVSQQ